MKYMFTLLTKTKSFLLIFMLLWAATSVSAQTTVTVSNAGALQTEITSATTGLLKTIILDSDISLTSMIIINGGKLILIQSDATHRTITWAGASNSASTPANFRHFTLTAANTTLTLEDVTLDGDNRGGGIEFTTGAVASTTLTINNSVIKNCYSTNSGGGVFVNNLPSPVVLNNTSFLNNRAGHNSSTGAWLTTGDGGAIAVTSATATATLTLKGDMIFSGNTSGAAGGAIHKVATGVFDVTALNSLKLTNNTARTSNGGGINTLAALDLSSTNVDAISGNKAGGHGGGIYSSTNLTLKDVSFIGNSAGYNSNTGVWTGNMDGGAIYSTTGLFVLQGAMTFINNMANRNGGAIIKIGATSGSNTFDVTGLNSIKLINDTARIGAGGGIYSEATLNLTGANHDTIIGNTAATNGGGIFANVGLILNNFYFKDNTSGYNSNTSVWGAGAGGAVYANNALELSGAMTFTGNTAGTTGGAIHKIATGTFTVSGLTSLNLTNNTARTGNGGGIYALAALNLSSTNVDTISGNKAGGHGGGIYSSANLTLKDVSFIGNAAGYNSNTGIWTGSMDGGAIYSTTGLFVLQGAMTFMNNMANRNGGAIAKIGATGASNSFDVAGLTSLKLINDTARIGAGGGIYSEATLNLIGANHDTIMGNTAGTTGGAIHAGVDLILNNFYFKNNTSGYNSNTLAWGTGAGGAVYAATVIELRGAITFTGNTAGGAGGALNKVTTGAFTVSALTSLNLTNNTARSGNGGGISTAAALNLSSTNVDTISGNSASAAGGAIYAGAVTLTLPGVVFANNSAGTNGGAIYNTVALTLNNSVFANNSAGTNGGAIYNTAALTLNNTVFTNNSAGTGNGGAVSNTVGDITLNNAVFANNSAGTTGGAIHITTAPLILLGNVVFDGNRAGTNGGAINKTTGVITVTNLTSLKINNNTANLNGGGIAGTATISVTNGLLKITNNKAITGNGGGIYTTVILTLNRTKLDTISGNTAGGHGGGIYSTAGNLTLKGLNFINNKAGYDGVADTVVPGGNGGAFTIQAASGNNANQVTLQGKTAFIGNTASQDGGAIFIPAHTGTYNTTNILIMQDTLLFSNNKAGRDGGAICKLGTNPYTVTDLKALTFKDNTAIRNGGGIATPAPLTLPDAVSPVITGNTAGGSGGGIYAEQAVTLNNAYFADNTAGYDSDADTIVPSGNGGAIAIIGTSTYILTLKGAQTFINNRAGGSGGAIHRAGNIAFTVSGLTSLNLKNNAAITGDGGGIYTGVALVLTYTKLDTISGNTAGGFGGAIYSTNALTLSNFYFSNNTAGYNSHTKEWTNGGGGAVCANNALTLQNAMAFINNKAGGDGGAIHKSATGTVTLTAANKLKLRDNKARGNGGAIYTSIALTLNNTTTDTITGNIALGNGGAITAAVGTLILNGLYLSNNKAGYDWITGTWLPSGNGGAVASIAALLTLQNVITFVNDTAGGHGGAIYKAGTEAFTVTAPLTLTVNKNTTIFGDGGGIYANISLSFANSTTVNLNITNNTAGRDGGGIFTTDNETYNGLRILTPAAQAIFSGNTASQWSMITTGDIPLTNAVFGTRAQNTYSLNNLGIVSQYGLNNYDVNYAPTYLVTFMPNNGNPSFSQRVRSGRIVDVSLLSPITNPGYGFQDWYDNAALLGAPFALSTPITQDTVLYAKWGMGFNSFNTVNCWQTDTINVLTWNNSFTCNPADLTVTILPGGGATPPASATVVNNKIVYTYPAGFTGRDTLEYSVSCALPVNTYTKLLYIAVTECPENIGSATCFMTPTPPITTLGIRQRYQSPPGDVVTTGTTAVVGDIDNCGEAEILILNNTATNDSHQHDAIYVYAVDKTTDTLYRKYTISVPPTTSAFKHFNPVAIAKIEGETYPSVFFVSAFEGTLYKYEFDGTIWAPSWSVVYTTNPTYYPVSPTIADFMGSGRTQIAMLDKIIDAKSGAILVDAGFVPASGVSIVYNFGRFGALESAYPQCYESSLVAMDVDGDGIMELIGGGCVYGVNLVDFDHANPGNTYILKMQASKVGHTDIGDGGTALADFDNCGLPEVVVVCPVNSWFTSSANATVYIYNPRTGALLHTNSSSGTNAITIPRVGTAPAINGPSRPVVGNFGRAGYPVEVAVAGSNTLRTYRLVGTTLTLGATIAVTNQASAAPSVFDFVHDGKARLVYRDRGQLRIIDASGAGVVNATLSNTHSVTNNEYPVVADINGDGAAEIVVAAGSVANDNRGQLRIYVSELQPWAPARAVWNQMSYYALNVNDDLTTPSSPMNTGTVFPGPNGLLGTTDDVRPFNNFIAQQTTLDENGNKLWRTPNLIVDVEPTATIAGDSVVFTGCIKNLGDAPVVAPIYISYYKNNTLSNLNVFLVDTLHFTLLEGNTYCFSKTVANVGIYAPMDSIWISINDRNGVYPYQMQCNPANARRGFPFALKSANEEYLEIVDCLEQSITVDVLTHNNVTSCPREEVILTVFPSKIPGNSFQIVGDDILFTYSSGFQGRDTLNYVMTCHDTLYGGRVFIRVVPCPDNMDTAKCTDPVRTLGWDIKLMLTESTTVSARSIPLVGDINGDGDIEIIVPGNIDIDGINANNLRLYKVSSILLPAEKFRLQQTLTLQASNIASAALPYFNVNNNPYSVANVDGGQYAAIFVAGSSHTGNDANAMRRLIKFTTTNGTLYTRAWAATGAPEYSTVAGWDSPHPIIANFNAGNMAHVMVYGKIYTTTGTAGTLLLDILNGAPFSAGKGFTANSTMAVADIDDDGVPEIIAGNFVYKVNITNNTAATGNSVTSIIQADTIGTGRTEITDGSVAVADMTGDGFLDVIVTTEPVAGTSALYIWNPRTRELLNNNVVTFSGNISTPTVGDIDGDGKPEICVTTTDLVSAYDYDASSKQLTVKWTKAVNNPSGTTAVTLFDFDQNGANELVFRDAENLMILNGADGADRTSIPCGSATGREYPVIADINKDGAAEIIVTGGATNANEGQLMIFSSGTAKNKWAPARKVWNQYAYNIVNIKDNLTVPAIQMNTATFFPKQNNNFYPKIKQPYNGYLMQQTLFDTDADPLWITTNIRWTSEPVVGFLGNGATFNGCIENIGQAGLQAPVYLSFYKNDPNIPSNVIGVGSLNTFLLPNVSYCIYSLTLNNIDALAPVESVWISLNDSAGIYPYQQQCNLSPDGRREVQLLADNIRAGIPECYDSLTVDVRPYMAARDCSSSSNVTTSASLLGATITTTDTTFTYYWTTIANDTLNYSVNCNGITLQGKIFITPILCPAVTEDIIIKIDSACYGAVATLTASAPTVINPKFRWYNSQTGSVPLWEGDIYTTPNLMASVQLFVSVFGDNTSENAKGNRKLVNLILKPTPSVIMKSDCEEE